MADALTFDLHKLAPDGPVRVRARASAPAQAQYFGPNPVQYERFEFHTLRAETFDISHYPAETESVRHAARLAEAWRTRLASLLGFDLPRRPSLVLYASHSHFTHTPVIGGLIGEGTGGVTESLTRRMVLPFGSSLAETTQVLGHAMVHAFQTRSGGADRRAAAVVHRGHGSVSAGRTRRCPHGDVAVPRRQYRHATGSAARRWRRRPARDGQRRPRAISVMGVREPR